MNTVPLNSGNKNLKANETFQRNDSYLKSVNNGTLFFIFLR